MSAEKERVWYWKQSKGNKLKVISNRAKGTLKVFNEKGKLIFERKDLTEKQLKIVEENFLAVVTNKIKNMGKSLYRDDFDPMIA